MALALATFLLLFAVPITANLQDKLYWSDASTGKIQRANLADGSDVEDLVSGIGQAKGLVVDEQHCSMYWIDTADFSIKKATLEGTGVEEFVPNFARFMNNYLWISGGMLYFSADLGQLIWYRISLDGDGEVETLNYGGRSIGPLVVDTPSGGAAKIYALDDWENIMAQEWGSTRTTWFEGAEVVAMGLDTVDRQIYWADTYYGPGIRRASMDSSSPTAEVVVPGYWEAVAVASVGRKMYMVAEGGQEIRESDLAGNLGWSIGLMSGQRANSLSIMNQSLAFQSGCYVSSTISTTTDTTTSITTSTTTTTVSQTTVTNTSTLTATTLTVTDTTVSSTTSSVSSTMTSLTATSTTSSSTTTSATRTSTTTSTMTSITATSTTSSSSSATDTSTSATITDTTATTTSTATRSTVTRTSTTLTSTTLTSTSLTSTSSTSTTTGTTTATTSTATATATTFTATSTTVTSSTSTMTTRTATATTTQTITLTTVTHTATTTQTVTHTATETVTETATTTITSSATSTGTTTTTSTAPLQANEILVVDGSLGITVSDTTEFKQAFDTDPAVKTALTKGIAEDLHNVSVETVEIVEVSISRRLSSFRRRLAGVVNVDYRITMPPGGSQHELQLNPDTSSNSAGLSSFAAGLSDALAGAGVTVQQIDVAPSSARVVQVSTTTGQTEPVQWEAPSKKGGAASSGVIALVAVVIVVIGVLCGCCCMAHRRLGNGETGGSNKEEEETAAEESAAPAPAPTPLPRILSDEEQPTLPDTHVSHLFQASEQPSPISQEGGEQRLPEDQDAADKTASGVPVALAVQGKIIESL